MYDGQYLHASQEGSVAVYSPWFPRGGDGVRCTLEALGFDGTGHLTVHLFHKNENTTASYDGEEVDPSITLQITSAQGPGRTTAEWTGLRELVRYKIVATDTGAVQVFSVLFRLLDPEWFDAVDAAGGIPGM